MTEEQLKQLIILAEKLQRTIKTRNMFEGTINYSMEVLTSASELVGYILSFKKGSL